LPIPALSLLSIPGFAAPTSGAAWRGGDWAWLGKRLLQSAAVRLGGAGPIAKRRPSESGLQLDHPQAVSVIARRLLIAQQGRLSEIAARRRDNFRSLANAVDAISGIEVAPQFARWSNDCPYALPLFVEAGKFEGAYSRLWANGVPAQTWPDLPPEVIADERRHSAAIEWQRKLMLIPVHQSLTRSQIDLMRRALGALK
jgi:hypothetical protein